MKKSLLFILCSLFLSACAKSEWQLVWNDEFDGESLNEAYWNVEDNAVSGISAYLSG